MTTMRCALAARPVLAFLASCASTSSPPVAADPAVELARADRLMETEPETARQVLESLDEGALVPEEVEAYEALYADALFRTGEGWDGFKVIRDFVEDHRFSDWTDRVEEVHFRIGEYLIQSDGTYWIFGSDLDDGEVVLQEFIERYSTNPHVPDALRLLGGAAFDAENWSLARRRYEQILLESPDSEWVSLARFRRVMSIHAELLGPEYDLPAMRKARNELSDYLDSEPERPEFREQAAEALAEVRDWIGQRHMIDADFYRTVGNRYGERLHLERLIADSPGHPLVDQAELRIAELEAGR